MSTRDAVIVSTARTPIGRAYKGAFNATPSPTLAAHAIRVLRNLLNHPRGRELDAAVVDAHGSAVPGAYAVLNPDNLFIAW